MKRNASLKIIAGLAVIISFFSGEIKAQADDDRHIIMPLGNSLTNDSRSRTALWYTLGSEIGFDADSMWFVGSQYQEANIPPDYHEGVGGIRIGEVADKMESILAEYEPDYISLLIGTNDIAWDFKYDSPEDMRDAYIELLDILFQHGPSGMWVVAGSVPLVDNVDNAVEKREFINDFNELLKILVEERFENGDRLLYAPISENLNINEHFSDGVHLNNTGYEIMGTQQALALIPALLSSTGIPFIADYSLSVQDVGAENFTVEFTKAFDDEYSADDLSYTLLTSEDDNLNTVPNAEEFGTVMDVGVNVSELTATNLSAGTEYWFNILVENPDGKKAVYSAGSITIPSPASVVENIYHPRNDTINVELDPEFEWKTPAGAESYNVQLSANSDFSELITDTMGVETTTLTMQNALNYNTQYYWRVMAVNGLGAGEWSESWSFHTVIEKPEGANLLEPVNRAVDVSNKPVLVWDLAERAEYYELQLAGDSTFSEIIIDSILTDTVFSMEELLPYGSSFLWRVKAYNDGGGSEWSNIRSFTVIGQLDTVQLLEPLNEEEGASLEPTLIWSTVRDAEEYKVEMTKEHTTGELVFDSTFAASDTSYIFDEELAEDTHYFWSVQALKGELVSEWAEYFSFKTMIKTSIEDEAMPVDFTLKQNYPNPFNPSTKIEYGIPEPSDVRLEVYNSLGQKVITLVNESKPAGWHTATFDGSRLSSGFYIYRIKAKDFVSTKKLMLIK